MTITDPQIETDELYDSPLYIKYWFSDAHTLSQAIEMSKDLTAHLKNLQEGGAELSQPVDGAWFFLEGPNIRAEEFAEDEEYWDEDDEVTDLDVGEFASRGLNLASKSYWI